MLKNNLSLLPQLGETFDETTPDGRDVVATVTFEDGKIVAVQKAKKEGQKSTRVGFTYICWATHVLTGILQSVREMNGADELVYTITVLGCDLACVQKFKRV